MLGKHSDDLQGCANELAKLAVGLAVIGIIVALIMVVVTSAELGAWNCKRRAEAMQVNWMHDPIGGCYIQQPNGSWTPIDPNAVRYTP